MSNNTNQQVSIVRNVTYQYETYHIPNELLTKTYIIPRNGDLVNLEYFHFTDANLTMNQFKDIIRHCSCKLYISSQEIVKYDFEILIELNQVRHVNDTFIVKIPQFLLKDIIFVSMTFYNATLAFNLTHQFSKICVVTKLTFQQCQENRILFQQEQHKMMQQLNKVGEIDDTNINQFVRIQGNNLTKGIFIIGDINNINKIQLFVGAHNILFDYDYVTLHSLAHIISNNMFYLSFEGSNNYDNLSNNSLVGSINFNHHMLSLCTIKFDLVDSNKSSYKVYSLSAHIMHYMRGFGILEHEVIDENKELIDNLKRSIPKKRKHDDIDEEVK